LQAVCDEPFWINIVQILDPSNMVHTERTSACPGSVSDAFDIHKWTLWFVSFDVVE